MNKQAEDIVRAISLREALLVFLPFACGYLLSYLFRSVNAVIAPNLISEFGLSASELGLLTSVYFLTFASLQIPHLGLPGSFWSQASERDFIGFGCYWCFYFF